MKIAFLQNNKILKPKEKAEITHNLIKLKILRTIFIPKNFNKNKKNHKN